MLNIRWIRENPQDFDELAKKRRLDVTSAEILQLDTKHRYALTELQTLQARRNDLAKQFGHIKQSGGDITSLTQEGETIKRQIDELHEHSHVLDKELHTILAHIPNRLLPDVPEGCSEDDNKEIRKWGTPRTELTKPHHELGKTLGLMDFERSAKIAGARFVVLYGPLARLERALSRYMLDVHTEKFGYLEVYPPLLARDEAMFGTGQLPKFEEDQFKTSSGHWLIPTAEVVLTNLVAGEILEKLPLRFTAYTPCFRLEAGAAGKDTQGMMRQHQFGKVELVSIVAPEDSEAEHEHMTSAACFILESLNLPYRLMSLCAGDIGFCAQKTYDLEVWLPSEGRYREISSCSNCGDFQARRMNARYRKDGKPAYVHTLNGSGLAVGRALIAIMENYQQSDGSIEIPEVLRPYMGGMSVIKAL